ncbi:MAG: polysaccharide pyruvyl transferase family protein, partial [Pseudomonadota bacterium]
PFDTWWARTLARYAMSRSRTVVVRDAQSTAFLKELGVRTDVLEATDVAMRLPYARPGPKTSETVRVGLNVSGLLMSGGYSRSNQFGLMGDYPTLIRRILTWFQEQPDTEVHLVGHVQSETQPVEDDQRAGEALAAEFPGSIVAPVFHSPSEAKSYIAGLDFFMGARMHATIAAFSSGVPVVPMAYSRKFRGVFSTLGYEHVADMKTETPDAVFDRICEGFLRRDVLSADVAKGMEAVDDRLASYQAKCAEIIAQL